jgi:hypothetical protein
MNGKEIGKCRYVAKKKSQVLWENSYNLKKKVPIGKGGTRKYLRV